MVDVMRSSPPMPELERYTPPSLPPSQMNTPKRLGRIGGTREKALSQARATPPPPITYGPDKVQGSSQITPSKARFSQRLGVIGGRKTQSQMSQPLDAIPSIESEGEREEPTIQAKRSDPQTGSGRTTNRPETSPPPRARTAKSKEAVEQALIAPRETSEERADRRREGLKHQLAVQPGGGLKRKRKF